MLFGANTLGPRDLVLCAGTLGDPTFSDLVAAARAGGFNGISMTPAIYLRAHAQERLTDAAMRQMLADNGLQIAELDPLLNWVPGYPFNTAQTDALEADEALFARIAEALGARSFNAVWALPQRLPLSQLVDAFGALCERSAAGGYAVQLEFVPWAQIASVELAAQVVRQSGCTNAGIMFDSWHHFRGNTPNQRLDALPGEKIFAIQLNDAPAAAEADVIEETMLHRRLPGDGDIDLIDIVRRLDAIGCGAPVGVEVFSAELQRLPAMEAGRLAGDSIRRILSAARI